MSAIAFWVSPCPSAYSKSVTLGHFFASSSAEAVVTRRQLLPPNPSVMPRTISLSPHQGGASPPAAFEEPEPESEPPHAARLRTRVPAPRTASNLVRRV